jgi:hypothetical protein
MKRLGFIIAILALHSFNSMAQITQEVMLDDSTIVEVEVLDTITFAPNSNILSIKELIQFLQTDTSFYKAFKNLHFSNYNADHDIKIYQPKNGTIKASLIAETKNIYRDKCRWMNILEEHIKGDYYNKKKQPNYYTAQLYEDLFYEKDTICNEKNVLNKNYLHPSGSTIEKNKAQLKLLMFNPGAKIKGIPFIGNKASIFDEDVAKLYDFKIVLEEKNGVYCYLFEGIPKKGNEQKVVYQIFRTWLDRYSMQIVSREYKLKYSNSLYDFDVYINVNLQTIKDQTIVKDIYYIGNWRVISQGREKVTFKSTFYH